MSNYRRARGGNAYFFTEVTYQRQPILCLEYSRLLLREVVDQVRNNHPFFSLFSVNKPYIDGGENELPCKHNKNDQYRVVFVN